MQARYIRLEFANPYSRAHSSRENSGAFRVAFSRFQISQHSWEKDAPSSSSPFAFPPSSFVVPPLGGTGERSEPPPFVVPPSGGSVTPHPSHFFIGPIRPICPCILPRTSERIFAITF